MQFITSFIVLSSLICLNIIKINIYITNIKEINKVNKIYKSFFTKNFVTNFPTRSCVEVSALPQNSKIEIEAMAYKK